MQEDSTPAVSDASREALFRNDAFAIGALQLVSLVIVFVLVAQGASLTSPTGGGAIMIALTAGSASLACSVVAAFFRHEYARWTAKSSRTAEAERRQRRSKLAKSFRRWVRRLTIAATVLLVAALLALVVGMWARFVAA
jgi:hypothetical protein